MSIITRSDDRGYILVIVKGDEKLFFTYKSRSITMNSEPCVFV